MLDNHGNVVKKTIRYSGNLEEHLDKWYVIYAKREEISKRTGRLSIKNIEAMQYSKWSIEEKIDFIHDVFKTFYIGATNIYRGQLDNHDIDSIIWECASKIAKRDPLETFPNINHYIYNAVRGACADEAKKRKAIKRGGQTKFVYLDDPNTFLNIDSKEDISKLELKIWAEQIKSKLTKNEYKYIKLLLNISYIPTNREVAYLLNMTPDGVRYIKNSLKSKLPSLF